MKQINVKLNEFYLNEIVGETKNTADRIKTLMLKGWKQELLEKEQAKKANGQSQESSPARMCTDGADWFSGLHPGVMNDPWYAGY